jgi:hypothetical protein
VSTEADTLLQTMQDHEQLLLDTRRARSDRLFRITAYILSAAFIVALALFFFHYRLLNAELNAREQAEASLRALSVRLLELQDQERRKFSRELHDSLGQYLVGVKMNLTMLGNSVPPNALIPECLKLLDQAMTETRPSLIYCIRRCWTRPASLPRRNGMWRVSRNAAAFKPTWKWLTTWAACPVPSNLLCSAFCRRA